MQLNIEGGKGTCALVVSLKGGLKRGGEEGRRGAGRGEEVETGRQGRKAAMQQDRLVKHPLAWSVFKNRGYTPLAIAIFLPESYSVSCF
jgi:hypothetical protein